MVSRSENVGMFPVSDISKTSNRTFGGEINPFRFSEHNQSNNKVFSSESGDIPT